MFLGAVNLNLVSIKGEHSWHIIWNFGCTIQAKRSVSFKHNKTNVFLGEFRALGNSKARKKLPQIYTSARKATILINSKIWTSVYYLPVKNCHFSLLETLFFLQLISSSMFKEELALAFLCRSSKTTTKQQAGKKID